MLQGFIKSLPNRFNQSIDPFHLSLLRLHRLTIGNFPGPPNGMLERYQTLKSFIFTPFFGIYIGNGVGTFPLFPFFSFRKFNLYGLKRCFADGEGSAPWRLGSRPLHASLRLGDTKTPPLQSVLATLRPSSRRSCHKSDKYKQEKGRRKD